MRLPDRQRIVACLLVPFVVGAAACVDAPAARSPWRGWTVLRLKAKSVPLLHGHVELRLSEDASGRRLETSTSARFIGATIARSRTTTLLDSRTGRTRDYQSYSRDKGRHYVFGPDGYTVEKLQLVTVDGGSNEWEVSSRTVYPYPVADEEGEVDTRLFDYYGMLLALGQLALDVPGDRVTVRVATSKGPQAYEIRVEESRSDARSFTDLSTGVKMELATRELRLAVAPADPEAAEGFLRMEGETEIWVEAETKTVLEIVGKVPRVPGKVRLVLAAMG